MQQRPREGGRVWLFLRNKSEHGPFYSTSVLDSFADIDGSKCQSPQSARTRLSQTAGHRLRNRHGSLSLFRSELVNFCQMPDIEHTLSPSVDSLLEVHRLGIAAFMTTTIVMTTIIPCRDCIDLVGAARTMQPHHKLVPLTKNSDQGGVFQCDNCRCRWSVGLLGWSRLVD